MSWYRRNPGGEHVDGCDALLGDVMPEEHLPYVVLFASALGIRNGRRRARAIARLAADYRALFPPPTVLHRPPGGAEGLGP